MVLLNNKDYSVKYLINKVVYITATDKCQWCPHKEFCGVIKDVEIWGENNEYFSFQINSKLPYKAIFDINSNEILEILI